MSEEMHRSKLGRLKKKQAELEKSKAQQAKKLEKLNSEISSAQNSARRTKSETTRRSKERQIQSKMKSAADVQSQIASLDSNLASNFSDQHTTQRQLDRAVEQRQKKEAAASKKRQTEEMRHVKAVTREVEKQNRLYSERVSEQSVRSLPEKIRVLVFAANPADQQQLRLDKEVRDIGEKIRLAEYRDAVELSSRWAVRTSDLFQALNEITPSIVHFSGHGSEESLIFEDYAGNTKLVSKEAITSFIALGADHVRVVFFNACFSETQAEAAAQHVDVAIGMNAPIGDDAARVFAAQFYSAIGFGYSVQRAFDQALTQLTLEGITEEKTPQLFVREDVDADEVVLVRPALYETEAS